MIEVFFNRDMWNSKPFRLIGIFLIYFFFVPQLLHAQTPPELIISEYEITNCSGHDFEVNIVVTGRPRVYITYTVNGGEEKPDVTSTDINISLNITEPGEYIILSYGNLDYDVEDQPDTFYVYEYAAPQLYFTGGGTACDAESLTPLQVHFQGEAPFHLEYTLNEEPDELISNSAVYTFPTEGNYEIITSSLSDNNCTAPVIEEAYFRLLQVTNPSLMGDTVLCEGEQAIYRTDDEGFDIAWNVPDGNDFVEGVDEEGEYIRVNWQTPGLHQISVEYRYEGCASQLATLDVTIHDRPEAMLHPDTTLCFELDGYLHVQLDASSEDEYYWPDFDISDNEITIEQEGMYMYIQTNEFACSDSAYIRVTDNCIIGFHVPEAFTPNDDGINDELLLFGVYSRFEFTVYSPTGVILFKSIEKEQAWDGSYKGKPVPVGGYYWLVEYFDSDDKPYSKSGIVTIIR